MSEHRVLIFAYHFPPENAIGGTRPFRFYKYLPKYGYKCHVITAADVSAHPELDAEYVPDPFLKNPGKGIGWQYERLVRKLLLPGVSGTRWFVHAYRAGLRFVRKHKDSHLTILSTSPPLGPHLAAWCLTRTARAQWIVDFRDPLAGNPAYAHVGKHAHAAYAWLERTFVRRADCVIANTDEAEKLLKRKFPDESPKIQLIWNGFDPEERLTALPVPRREIRVLSHTGELYEGRSATPLLKSVARLIAAGQLSPDRFRIQLVGPVSASCLPETAFLKVAESQGWLKILPDLVPREEAQRIARSSDNLLLIQPHSTVQVPGKIFEYLQIGRPILALIPVESAIERILAKSGVAYRCVYVNSPVDIFDRGVLEFFDLDTNPMCPSPWFEETFNAEAQTKTLANLIAAVEK
jgi:glycosyltransferase involved in cell wall biosynthesis